MVRLKVDSPFPDVEKAHKDGLLAVGGDLSPERLLLAYNSGIFPWFCEGEPIMWWSPDPRFVLFPKNFKVSKSFSQTLKKDKFKVTFNQAFSDVISNCSKLKRKGQDDTWITQEMQEAYHKLHILGHAVSVEVWENDILVGGLYGVDLPQKKIFCGESMFSNVSEASKVAFYYLNENLKKKDYRLIDCQVFSSHLASLGAEKLNRKDFLGFLK